MSYLRSNSDSDSKESTPKPAGKQSYCVGFPQLRFPQACVLDLFEIGTLIPLLSRFPWRHSLLATIVKFVEMEHVFHQNNTLQLKSLIFFIASLTILEVTCLSVVDFNPFHSDISIYILHTVLRTFPMALTRRL